MKTKTTQPYDTIRQAKRRKLHILPTLTVLFLLLISVCACRDYTPTSDSESGVPVDLHVKLSGNIKDLCLMAFNKDEMENLTYSKTVPLDDPTTTFKGIESGNYDICLVANPTDIASELGTVHNLDQLNKLKLPYGELFEPNGADTTYVMSALQNEVHIKMGPGGKASVTYTDAEGTHTNASSLNIVLKRLMSKLKLTIVAKSDEVVPTGAITLNNLPDQVPLLDGFDNNSNKFHSEPFHLETPAVKPHSKASAHPALAATSAPHAAPQPVGDEKKLTYEEILVPSYLFKETNNKDLAAYISASINKTDKKAYIGCNMPDDYTLPRNSIYNVTAKANLDGINVSVLDWSTQDDNGTLPSGFHVSKVPSFPYNGASCDLFVTSLEQDEDEEGNLIDTKIPWKTKYSIDGGKTWLKDLPEGYDWLVDFPKTGSGGRSEKHTFSVKEDVLVGGDGDKILKNTPAVSNHDLSLDYNGKMNTANCYLVNAPGTYKFPVVYGNALKDGANNPSAYWAEGKDPGDKPNPTGENTADGYVDIDEPFDTLHFYPNYKGKKITKPWILDDTPVTNVKALMLWEDHLGLVSNVQIVSGNGGKYISFNVDQSTIRQGNALIGIRDETDPNKPFMWTWHIWVTNHKLTDVKETRSYEFGKDLKYDVLERPLGWESWLKRSNGRKILVRITQTQPPKKSKTIIIDQPHHTEGNATLCGYNWGVKDPAEIRLDLLEPRQKGDQVPLYGDYTLQYGDFYKTDLDMAFLIQHPNIYYRGLWFIYRKSSQSNTTATGHYMNLWSSNITASSEAYNSPYYFKIEKTIYDPSPPGFTVPPIFFTNIFGTQNDLNLADDFVYKMNETILAKFYCYQKNLTPDYKEHGTIEIPLSYVEGEMYPLVVGYYYRWEHDQTHNPDEFREAVNTFYWTFLNRNFASLYYQLYPEPLMCVSDKTDDPER